MNTVEVIKKIRVRHNCLDCNFHTYEIEPSNFKQGRRCPMLRVSYFDENKIPQLITEFIKSL